MEAIKNEIIDMLVNNGMGTTTAKTLAIVVNFSLGTDMKSESVLLKPSTWSTETYTKAFALTLIGLTNRKDLLICGDKEGFLVGQKKH